MRVLIASKYAGKLMGGAEISVEDFVSSRWPEADVIRLNSSNDDSNVVSGTASKVQNYISFPRFLAFEALLNIFAVRKAIHSISPEVIVMFSFWSVVAGCLDLQRSSCFIMLRAESCCGVKTRLVHTGTFPTLKSHIHSILWVPINFLIRLLLKRAKRRGCIFIGNSLHIATLCNSNLGFFPDEVIYPNVSMPRSMSAVSCSKMSRLAGRKYTVGFVGDDLAKGVEIVIALASIFPDLRFLVRARRWDKSAWVNSYPTNIFVESFTANMIRFFNEVDLVIYPSQCAEGFGRVLVEAARNKIICLYSLHSGLKEAGLLCGGFAKAVANYRCIVDWQKRIEIEMLFDTILKGKRIFRLSDECDVAALESFRSALTADLVTTNGCFDIIHSGHIASLQQSRDYGDFLIVGLNSDESVRRLKGAERPYQSESDRALILASLRMVDLVVIFDEDDPSSLIRLLRPHIHTKGADYSGYGEKLIENNALDEVGAELKFTDLMPDRSTTLILRKAKND